MSPHKFLNLHGIKNSTMKKIFYLVAFLGACNFSVAQYAGQVATNLSTGGSQSGGVSAQINTLLGPTTERNAKLGNDFSNFQGSPYISNTFLPTKMFFKEEDLGLIFYRYNALNEEIEIKKNNLDNEPIKSLARDKNISVVVDGKRMSFKTFVTSKKKTLNGYLIVLSEGASYDLFKRTHVKFTEGKAATSSFTKAVPSRFAQFTEYYLQPKGVARMDEISLKNGKLVKLVGDADKVKLKSYLKENDLNIKEEADLIKAIAFLNQK